MKTAIYKYEGPGTYMGAVVIVINSTLKRAVNQINSILVLQGLSKDAREDNVVKVDIVSGTEVYSYNGDY